MCLDFSQSFEKMSKKSDHLCSTAIRNALNIEKKPHCGLVGKRPSFDLLNSFVIIIIV